MDGQQLQCPVCAGAPSVLVAVAHRGLRTLIVELLERDHCGWLVRAMTDASELEHSVGPAPPDLVIVDAGDFQRCCRERLGIFPVQRVVVIGPEPDPAYERAARDGGAGAWLAGDRVGEDLSAAARAVLGCAHGPCTRPLKRHPPCDCLPDVPEGIFDDPARQPH